MKIIAETEKIDNNNIEFSEGIKRVEAKIQNKQGSPEG